MRLDKPMLCVVDERTYAAAKVLAERESRSLSGLLRWLLLRELKRRYIEVKEDTDGDEQ